jgi:hypothetical protein
LVFSYNMLFIYKINESSIFQISKKVKFNSSSLSSLLHKIEYSKVSEWVSADREDPLV